MDREQCKTKFYELVFPLVPNEWDVDIIVDEVVNLPDSSQELLLAQIPVIWPISHSLCLSFLEDGSRVVETIPENLISPWVRAILQNYEQEGLASARRLIAHVQEEFLQPLSRSNAVAFNDVSNRLRFYLRGISGEQVDIGVETIALTDTTTFYLPPSISLLEDDADNRLLYKFILTLHWGFCHLGTFRLMQGVSESAGPELTAHADDKLKEPEGLSKFINIFSKAELAADLFFLFETQRAMAWMRKDFPGLVRDFSRLRDDLINSFAGVKDGGLSDRVSNLGFSILFGEAGYPQWLEPNADAPPAIDQSPEAVFTDLKRVYDLIDILGESYERPPLMNLLGRHDFHKAEAEINRKRIRMKEHFISLLQSLQKENGGHPDSEGSQSELERADQTLIALDNQAETDGNQRLATIINNPETELPDELADLIKRIENDLGHIPPSYFSAASGSPGHGFNRRNQADSPSNESFDTSNDIVFDEWDHRRDGYRKNWCRIFERELPVLHSSFVNGTLEKHRGLLLKLRRQFEMMKTSEHFIRRQREGEDLDLDAIVEARGDKRAGISPSSKLFVRLQRNDRDIATIFLVDMSNSTEGWVGTVIKEALVLLCEVMAVAGDAYGILGFSGMRRSRCDLYRIKSIEEPYNQIIHQRINSVLPREYTRMGPAVRYASDKLKTYEARTRLLVMITDGKPEDYDDYKGDYAIEDTRKALMEARGSGLHTFCITVDREAHEYLPQMFGTGNYIFIDEIGKLPARMIDMYRLLTT